MADWKAQEDDTHTAKVDGYTLKVSKSAQFQSWAWAVTDAQRMRKAGNTSELEIAKVEAEQALLKLK